MMKIQQRFLFTLFLILVGLLALVSQANAGNPPDPIIAITSVERQDNNINIMVVRGTLDGTSQLPELAFSFLKPHSGTGVNVPVMNVDWESTSETSHRWRASLDLDNVPKGLYHILVSATFSNGTTITYILDGDPGECASGVCTPGG